MATRGLELIDSHQDFRESSSIVSRIYVEGYDTSLSGYDFVISMKKHFASCGEVLHVYIPGYVEGLILNRCTRQGVGHELVVVPYSFRAKHRFVVPIRKDDRAMSYLMYVDGYDTSLPVDYVESMLREHFSECGRVLDIGVPKENGDLLFREAYVTVLGIDALEKALQLDGCVRKGLENVKVCGVANPSKDGDSSGDMPPVSSWPPEYEISVMADATAPEDPNLPKPPPSVFTERPPTLKNRYAREDPSLPKPWKALVDCTTGFKYFWNTETNVTQYQRPPPSQLRPVISSSKRSSSRYLLRVRVRR